MLGKGCKEEQGGGMKRPESALQIQAATTWALICSSTKARIVVGFERQMDIGSGGSDRDRALHSAWQEHGGPSNFVNYKRVYRLKGWEPLVENMQAFPTSLGRGKPSETGKALFVTTIMEPADHHHKPGPLEETHNK